MTLDTAVVDQIVYNQITDPFAVLGPHNLGDHWVIRAVFPNASSAAVIAGDTVYPMQSLHHPTFFECELPVGMTLPDYRFRVERSWGQVEELFDPYRYASPRIGEMDVYLFGEGNHHRIYEKLGAHVTTVDGVAGVNFAVWAPNARCVSVLGQFNHWDGRQHPMQRLGNGIWQLFIPALAVGEVYKYGIQTSEGQQYEKTDPYGYAQEVRPKTGSVVCDLSTYSWSDSDWMRKRQSTDPLTQPISVYEVHLGSWLHGAYDQPPTEGTAVAVSNKDNTRFLTYRELADKLVPYVKELGFTHIELMPLSEHPLDASWGYQVIGYFATTSRYGTPQDFMYFVDCCHQVGLGVLMDWVPGHFPKDGHGLAFFDGAHLYEHPDPRRGEHKEWGTLVFDYGRNEVRNFLVANALFWFDKFHIDGIRVDAVASMLYLDYSREPGEWYPNQYGGREYIEAIECLKQLNALLFQYFPGTLAIAEESTAWPMVTWPTHVGGLGFNLKWNMGWMHDMLDYFSMDPWFRQFNHNLVTFSIMYAFNENFMLSLSHDEVVHGKSNMIGKVPGDEWGKFASLRCLYGFMMAHPGKKTLFMGMEFGQWHEWNVADDLQWELLQHTPHAQLKQYVGALNRLYCSEPALYEVDFKHEGFRWIDCNDTSGVVSFLRYGKDHQSYVVVICNFAPVLRGNYRIGVPEPGFYQELLNSDAVEFWGSGKGNLGGRYADDWTYHGFDYSLDLCLPPLSTLVLKLGQEAIASE